MKTKDREIKRSLKMVMWGLGVLLIILLVTLAPLVIKVSPIKAFGGVVWVKHGVHYLNNSQIANRIQQIDIPIEAQLANDISTSTPACDKVDSGFCQSSSNEYSYKTLVSPAVPFNPGTPDTKTEIGTCTLCNDGTFSPSCAVGRGACSYHSGVAAYNVAEYETIKGTPATQAKPAVYSYEPKTYKDSPLYTKPSTPSLVTVVGY